MRRQRKGNKYALETKRTRDTIPHTNRQNYSKEPGREEHEWQKAEGTDKEKSLLEWWLTQLSWQPSPGNFGFVVNVHTSKH